MKRILIVDDDEAILDAISIAITSEGYKVETLTEGDNTLARARDFKPNLILLDFLLSGKDGSEIVKDIKNDNTLKDVPVIIFSAHPSARETALGSGADEYLAKPFDIDHLFKLINRLIKDN